MGTRIWDVVYNKNNNNIRHNTGVLNERELFSTTTTTTIIITITSSSSPSTSYKHHREMVRMTVVDRHTYTCMPTYLYTTYDYIHMCVCVCVDVSPHSHSYSRLFKFINGNELVELPFSSCCSSPPPPPPSPTSS